MIMYETMLSVIIVYLMCIFKIIKETFEIMYCNNSMEIAWPGNMMRKHREKCKQDLLM